MPRETSPRAKSPSRTPTESTAHQLKVTLRWSSPPIWRRIVVPSDIDLGSLHTILQVVMPWTDSHLHQFEVKGQRFSTRSFELDDRETADEDATELRAVAPRRGSRLVYEYDFGDDWKHDIVVEKVREATGEGPLVSCLDGAGACPPDDCGGMGGYEDLLAAVSDADHPDHDQMLEWAGGPIDPEAFDLEAVNRHLAQLVRKRA